MLPEFCPVTKKKILTKSDWQYADDEHSFSIGVIDNCLVLTRSKGIGNMDGARAYSKAIDLVLEEYGYKKNGYVLLEDFSEMIRTSNESREYYLKFMTQRQEYFQLIVFFGLTSFMKLSIKLAKKLNITKAKMENVSIADNYQQAMEIAVDRLGKDWLSSSLPTMHIEKREMIDDNLKVFCELYDNVILATIVDGKVNSHLMEKIAALEESVLEHASLPNDGILRILDLKKMTYADFGAAKAYAVGLKKLDKNYHCKFGVVTGATLFHRTMTKMFKHVVPYIFTFRDTLEDGIYLLKHFEHDNISDKENARKELPGSETFEKYATEVLRIIGETEWENPEKSVETVPDDHPFKEVVDAIKLVKYNTDLLTAERNQREQALRLAKTEAEFSNKIITEFISNISHEMRTPMNGILGLLELARESETIDEMLENITVMEKSAHRLFNIIQDLLTFSSIEQGTLSLEMIDFNLFEMVHNVSEEFRMVAEEKGLLFYSSVAADIPQFLHGDEKRIKIILTKLLDNAIKFTESGKIECVADLVEDNGENITLQFRVADTGIGISPDEKELIFSHFYQGDGSSSRKYRGIGLGLSMVKKLLDLMEGSLSIKSEPGEGSEIIFRISLTHIFQKGCKTPCEISGLKHVLTK